MDKIRIALADDHEMIREGIIAMLDKDEYEIVISAPDGVVLLDKLAGLTKLPHVCLLDIRMPEKDGYETLIELRKTYPKIEVLILSQYEDQLVVIKMLKAGAKGYLHKDCGIAELKEAIGIAASGSYFQNAMVTGHVFASIQKDDDDKTLTDDEMIFLRWAFSQLEYSDIGKKMNKSKRTVEGYAKRLFGKIGTNKRVGLVLYALKIGLEPLE